MDRPMVGPVLHQDLRDGAVDEFLQQPVNCCPAESAFFGIVKAEGLLLRFDNGVPCEFVKNHVPRSFAVTVFHSKNSIHFFLGYLGAVPNHLGS